MEENRMKKAYSWILILSMVFTVLFSGFACETVNAATNLKSVYTKFVKQLRKNIYYFKVESSKYNWK